METASRGYMTPPNFLVPASSRLYPRVELPRPGLWHPTRTGPGRRSRPLPSPHLFWPRETSVWLCPWCPGSPRRAASPWRRGLQGAYLGPLEKLPFSLAEAKRDLGRFSLSPCVMSGLVRSLWSCPCAPPLSVLIAPLQLQLQVRGLETRPA